MAEYCGLYIAPDAVRGELLKMSGKKMEVVDRFSAPWSDGESLAAALKACAERFAGHTATWVAGLPFSEFSLRPLSFPFANRSAIASAIPFELEATLPWPADDMEVSFAVLSSSKEKTDVLACAARKERLNFYRERLKEAGIAVRGLMPDATALLHFQRKILVKTLQEEQGNALIATVEGKALVMCYVGENGFFDLHCAEPDENEVRRFAASLNAKEPRYFTGGEGARAIFRLERSGQDLWKTRLATALGGGSGGEDRMIPIGLAVAASAYSDELLFGMGNNKISGVRAALTFSAIGFSMAVLLAIGFLFYRNHAKERTFDQVNQQIRNIYSTAVPGGKPVKPMLQMKQKLASLQLKLRRAGLAGNTRVDLLWLLKRMAESVPEGLTVELDEVTYEEDGVIILGKSDKFESVTKLKELYAATSPFKGAEVLDSHAVPDGKKVSFKIRMPL